MGIFKDIASSIAEARAAKRNARAQRKAAEEQQSRLEAATWEPEYVSDHIGPYQRSKSPVASAYLQSFLTGTNPQISNSSVEAGGQGANYFANRAFDKQYGGWDELQRQQAQMENSTPWEVKPITRSVDKEVDPIIDVTRKKETVFGIPVEDIQAAQRRK